MKNSYENRKFDIPGEGFYTKVYGGTNTVVTYSGQTVHCFKAENPESFRIEDIAHALSQQCQYGGAARQFFSLAQHAVMCTWRVPDELKYDALMIHASKAYLVDLPRPLKLRLSEYVFSERKLMRRLAKHFRFTYPFHPEVIQATDYLYALEYEMLILGKKVRVMDEKGWEPIKAETNFLATYYMLREVRGLHKLPRDVKRKAMKLAWFKELRLNENEESLNNL